MSNGHPASCRECVNCRVCEQGAWCLSEPGAGPCPHLEPLCGDCVLGPEGCVQCRLEAEAEMHATGVYDPSADPFFDHTANPQGPPVDPFFNPVTNNHHYPKAMP